MPSHDFTSIVEPRVRSSKPVNPSFSRIIESPMKITKRRNEGNTVSPYRPTKRHRSSDIVEPPIRPASRKSSSTKRDQSRRSVKSREKKNVESVSLYDGDGGYSDGVRFCDDGGGFGDSSSDKCYGVMDGIDWRITGDDVEELKSQAVPEYWESLLDSPYGVVRVMEHLYILRDWHPMGPL